jgi:RNA polymerase sigma factor for flagellar operon FliA
MTSIEAAYRNQSDNEIDRIVMEELPQVRYIARRIYERLPKHVPFEDLVNAGVLGLIDAAHKFDPLKNVQFKSYAKFRIRGAILDSLRDLDWGPRELRRKARKIEEATSRLNTRLGRSANEAEIAKELEMDLEEFQQVLGELDGLDLGSLQTDSRENSNGDDLCEFLPGDPELSPYYLCLRSEIRKHLASAISELSSKEQQVLSLYYYEELTMKEVGAVLGIGESRVSQIHTLAMIRLRTKLMEILAMSSTHPLPGSVVDTLMEATWRKS